MIHEADNSNALSALKENATLVVMEIWLIAADFFQQFAKMIL
jgi:hypothetical protein